MNYIPVIAALSLAILYIVIRVPPSAFSKAACVALALALLYFVLIARNDDDAAPFEEEPAVEAKRPGEGGPNASEGDGRR